MAIAGIVLSAIGIFMNVFILYDLVAGEDSEAFWEGFREGLYEGLSDEGYEDHFWGHVYSCSDDSIIYFYDDGTFEWFITDQDYNNVGAGTYETRFGRHARNYLVYEHPEYGVTEEELDAYYARNAGDTFYCEENLTTLTLTTEIIAWMEKSKTWIPTPQTFADTPTK